MSSSTAGSPPVDPLPSGSTPPPEPGNKNSYGQIIKSSSLIGGSTLVNMVIGFARAKAAAVFLGTEGVGLIGVYTNLLGTLRNISGMGINSSGVREVASAAASSNTEEIAKTIRTLRKVCWLTGGIGWVLAMVLAWPLSRFVFGDNEHVWPIVVLGSTLLLAQISAGQMAIVQGLRKIKDIALLNVTSAALTAMASIGLFWLLGMRGIIPSLLATAAITLLLSWNVARRICIQKMPSTGFAEALGESKKLLAMGAAFMWSGTMGSLVMLIKISVVTREIDLEAAGLFTAASNLSTVFILLSCLSGSGLFPGLYSL